MCSVTRLVSFAAVIQVVTQCSSPSNGCSLELCIPFPLLLRTNNMHVTVSSYANYISRYICRQRSRFPRNGSLLPIGQFKERNAALECAAVSWGGALRDDPNNGCEGDYYSLGSYSFVLNIVSIVAVFKTTPNEPAIINIRSQSGQKKFI